MAFMGGHSQGLLYFAQAGGLYVLYLLPQCPTGSDRGRAVALLAGFGVVALGLISVQLLPSLEHAAGATRNLEGLTLEQASLFPLMNEQIRAALTGSGVGYLALPLLFVPLTVAALLGRGSRGTAWFFLFLFVLTVDFMRGTQGVVFPIYYQLPFGDLFRIPLRMGIISQFAAAMLMGIGVTAAVSWLPPRRSWVGGVGLAVVLCIAGDVFVRNAPPFPYEPLVRPDRLYGPPRLLELAPMMGHDRMFVIGIRRPKKFGQVHGMFELTGYEPALPRAYAEFFDVPPEEIWHGQLDVVSNPKLESAPVPQYVQDPALLDFLSVRYYVDARSPWLQRNDPLATVVDGSKLDEGSPAVYQRALALPRTYLVHEVRHARSDAEALAWMREGSFDKRRAAVIHEPIAPLEPLVPGAAEHARILDYRSGRVRVEASCASACLLVLTDLFDANWHVRMDGQPVPLARVNHLVRGVRLPAGEHRVDFVYEPASLRLGASISLATFVLVAGVMGGSRLRRSGLPRPRRTRGP
jgi:hypothetical protein